MSVIIVSNPENSKIDKQKMQQKFNQIGKNCKDVKFKENAAKDLVGTSSEIILLGRPIGSAMPKATYFAFENTDEHYLYYFREDAHTVAHLPKNVQSVAAYESDFRIYDDTGICYTFHNPYPEENMQVFSDGKHLYVRVGETHKQKLKRENDKALAKMGIWRA
jgi:hypothetical protein